MVCVCRSCVWRIRRNCRRCALWCVPPSNGLRYAAALNARGVDCRTRVFPEDAHGLVNPRTEFESFVTIAGFLREHVGGPGEEPDEGGGTGGE